MIFSPTSKYLLYASSAVKTYRWQIFVKKTTDISEALSSGTWVEATRYVDLDSLADQMRKLEFEVGQFVSDSISLTGSNIAWWNANVFNASSSEYIEVKIQFTLSQGSDICSDTVYTFSGFIDKVGPQYSEIQDSVIFHIYTVQDLGQRLAAENITAQYVDTDIDGSGTDGLVLPEIHKLFVKDAAVAGYLLKPGTHIITYDYNAGAPQAALDSGIYVVLSNGSNTLTNPDLDEKVVVYVVDKTKLPKSANTIDDNVVVVTEGDTLPRQWYKYVSVRFFLRKVYAAIGITSVTQGTLEIPTDDGNNQISFLDAPPGDGLITGFKYAMVSDGTDLWIGVSNKLYKRTMSDDSYSLKATLTAGRVITRLFYNSANGHIWVYFQQSITNETGYVLRHTISGGSNSSEITLTGSTWYAAEVYAADTFYGLVYADSINHTIRAVPSSTMTDGVVITQATLGYTSTEGPDGNFSFLRSGKLYFQTSDTGASYYHRVFFAAGLWEDDGKVLTMNNGNYQVGAFHVSEDRIYYYDPVDNSIESHPYISDTRTNILTLDASGEIIEGMQYLNSKVWFTTPKYGYFYEIASNVATLDNPDGPRLFTKFFAFAYIDRIYGLDEAGRIYQFHTTLALYLALAKFEGERVTDCLNRVLTPFNLVSTINPAKRAYVYMRGDSTGEPETTGNSLSLTAATASDIQLVKKYISGCQMIEVTNVNNRVTYNGTVFNDEVLSDARVVTISSELIPDYLLRSLAKHCYQFFKTDRDLYRIPMGHIPQYQFEPFDGVSVTFTGTKIQKTATGVIYTVTAHKDAQMTVEALI